MRLRNGVQLFERPHQLARFLAEQALCKLHRLPLELVSTAFDQLCQLADSRIVVEAITPLSAPLGEDGEVVILTDQVRQRVGTPGEFRNGSYRKVSAAT